MGHIFCPLQNVYFNFEGWVLALLKYNVKKETYMFHSR